MLEDIYTEDLVDSPDDIERVIEGGEDDKQDESGNESGDKEQKNEGENMENNEDKDKKTKVRRKLGPRLVLNAQRLNGPRGIGVLESFFSDINLKGKGHEKEDLDLVMKRLEHWAHRLAPRMQFDDCLKKIEKLGSKKEVASRLNRIRIGFDDDTEVTRGDVVEDAPDSPPPVDDPFDQLISSSTAPAAPVNLEMTAEQREQMLRNRLIAEERRAARIKKAQEMKQKYQEKLLLSQSQVVLPEESGTEQPVRGGVQDDIHMEDDAGLATVDVEALTNHVDLHENNVPQAVQAEENQTDVLMESSEDNYSDVTNREIVKSDSLEGGVVPNRDVDSPNDDLAVTEYGEQEINMEVCESQSKIIGGRDISDSPFGRTEVFEPTPGSSGNQCNKEKQN